MTPETILNIFMLFCGGSLFLFLFLVWLATWINDHMYPRIEIPVTGETQMHGPPGPAQYALLSPVNEHTKDNERRNVWQEQKIRMRGRRTHADAYPLDKWQVGG